MLKGRDMPIKDTMDDENAESDRRRYARHPGPFKARCPGRECTQLRVMDLGLGGCFILVGSERTAGETFQIQIELGDAGVLDVSATLLYHTFNGSAVTFLDLNQNALTQIARTVASQGVTVEPRPTSFVVDACRAP